MVKIAFWDNFLGERGTTVALYDYAYYNKTILGNESIIIYNSSLKSCDDVVHKFKKEFEVYGIPDFSLADSILISTKCDMLYIIKSGEYDGKISNVVKTCVHCVFNCSQPHGHAYASISPWVYGNNGRIPFVPHMISLPEHDRNLRQRLNIPENAMVYGRYGGYEQFDLPFVHKTVYQVALQYPSIYFLFANTKPFCNPLPNIIHLDKIIDLDRKVEFINTCDAMLWGRSDGETFGIAIGEFSIKNKPVICTNIGYPAHIHLLKNKAIWYTPDNLYTILTTLTKEVIAGKDWNAYSLFTPEKVMSIFKRIFIDSK